VKRPFADREQRKQDLNDEIASHLRLAAQDRRERGEPPERALESARREMGNENLIREAAADQWGWRWLEQLLQDMRYGARTLRRKAGFTGVAALTLALGIGATTAIFSAVNTTLFEPLPYPHPERILMIWDTFQGARSDVTFHTYREIAARNRSFAALGIFEPWQPALLGRAEPERLDGQSVSYGYFSALGVSPALGRGFEPADNAFHGPNVAILSHGLWQRRFGGDASIVGRQVTLDGDAYTIVGVMPRGFEDVLAPTTEIWSPEQYDQGHINDTDTAEWGHHLRMVARLKPGVSFAQANADIAAIAGAPVPEFPRPRWAALKFGFIVDSLQDDVTRAIRPALLAVLGAVMLVLLIACVNVTNLLLARGALRRPEFAMPAALGAGRTRMLRQLLTESLLLAAIGGALGIVVAELGVQALVALSPPELPRVGAIGLDRNVLLFTIAVTTLIGLAVGLVPAVHASHSDLQTDLKQGSRQSSGSHQLTRRALVVAEVGLAMVLLASAGLLFRSLTRLFAVDPGFDASHLLTLQVQTSGHAFDNPDVTRRFFHRALEEVRRNPAVESAALTSLLPLTDDTQFGLYGTSFQKTDRSYDTFRYVVVPGYFETMRIPLRRGRYLEDRDAAAAPHVTVISESLAKKAFGDEDPLGQLMRIGGFPNWPLYTVVGVVADVSQVSLSGGNAVAAYITPEQSWFADQAMSLVVRARGDAAALAPEIRSAVWSVNKDQPIVRVATMERLLAALVLAAVGIYGVLAGSVAERTREIGVRVALGASRGDILAMVMRQGMTLTVIGALIGLAAAAAASRALVTLLFGVSRLDVLLLLGVSAISCWVPARRAAQVDPAITLRSE